ncbi:MAG: 3-hydroxyacyl-CoA dehydrogenase family protein [Acidobacteriota bacterium]
MKYEEILGNVTVLGAAGKMGSGILLLTAVEMADLSMMPENKDRSFVLNAMDVSDSGLAGLMEYLKVQVTKIAEKKTVALRKAYEDRADLIENGEIIEQYVFDVLNIVRPTTGLDPAYRSNLIFEAVNENPELKVKIFKDIEKNTSLSPWYFTNTSSVPIGQLDKDAELGGRILGFHFYNPPAVQKLVEVIVTDDTLPEVKEFAAAYAKKLRKITVPSNDFAGFIGNGHFMRDALHGIEEAKKISGDLGFAGGVFALNRVSQELLVRPMGIFQLIDYVGIDVCQYIMQVMNPHLKDEDLHSEVLDMMIDQNVKGGQNSDGSQKDGFLKYEKGRPVAIYDPDKKDYVPIDDIKENIDKFIGKLPDRIPAWKNIIREKGKDSILTEYFRELKSISSNGADLAVSYINRSKEIGEKLVADNVAANETDVNTVMLTGFFHAYGPINDFLNQG